MNHDFLTRHNGTKVDRYWANWDLANIASMLAIGVLTDRRDIYSEAVEYLKHGHGSGTIQHVIWKRYRDGRGQIQESGRDGLIDIPYPEGAVRVPARSTDP